MSNGNHDATPKHCPFLDKECIQETCALWTYIRQITPGPLGVGTVSQRGVCALTATPMVMSAPRPNPTPVNLGKLKGPN